MSGVADGSGVAPGVAGAVVPGAVSPEGSEGESLRRSLRRVASRATAPGSGGLGSAVVMPGWLGPRFWLQRAYFSGSDLAPAPSV